MNIIFACASGSFHAMTSAPTRGAAGKLYVFGGCLPGHRRESDLHEYDIATNVWRQLPTTTTADDGTVTPVSQAYF